MRDNRTKRTAEAGKLTVDGFPSELADMTNAEVQQLQAIGAVTISSAQWGYLGDMTGHPVNGDAAGRVLRLFRVVIDNGSNPNTIKVKTTNIWNGAALAEVDNLAAAGSSGNFSLGAGGVILTISNTNLGGNVLGAIANLDDNPTGTAMTVFPSTSANNLLVRLRNATTGAAIVLATAVDVGAPIQVQVLYITSG